MWRRALRTLATGAAAAALVTPQAAAAAVAARPAKPQRIMSINMCTDLVLLQLVPKVRIASVTWLAHDGVQALFPGADAKVAVNHGTAEDIINQRPDLILAGAFTTPMTRKLARKIGARVVEVKMAASLDDARDITLQIGAAVGETARAELLVQRMDAILADLTAHPPARRLRVVAWSGGSSVPGQHTLTNDIIKAAGALNIAAQPGATASSFGTEELLAADPDALLYGGERTGPPSMHTAGGQHRVVRRRYADRSLSYTDIAYGCGLPQSADAARDLRRALESLPRQRPIP